MQTWNSIQAEMIYRSNRLQEAQQQAQSLKPSIQVFVYTPRSNLMKNLHIVLFTPVLVLALAACGSSIAPNPVPTSFNGTWNDTVKNEYGVVRTQFKLTQSANQVSGEAYFSNKSQLLHVGSVSGSVAADGSAQLLTILSDNGASGKAKLLGSFKGVGFEGILSIYKADGNLSQMAALKITKVSEATSVAAAVSDSAEDLGGW